MSPFTTIADVMTNYVEVALAGFADEYDVEAIAREVATYSPEVRGFVIDEAAFWPIVAMHELCA